MTQDMDIVLTYRPWKQGFCLMSNHVCSRGDCPCGIQSISEEYMKFMCEQYGITMPGSNEDDVDEQ